MFGGEVVDPGRYVLRVQWPETVQETEDPYSFGTLLGDVDLHLINEGTHRHLGDTLGAQVIVLSGVPGVRFAVWAPNARRVSVVGDFNNWDGRRHAMRLRHPAGVWELFIPRLRASPWMGALLDGVNMTALGLMAGVTLVLGRAAIVDWLTALLAVVAALLLIRFKVNSAWLVLGGGLVGFATYLLR